VKKLLKFNSIWEYYALMKKGPVFKPPLATTRAA